MIFTAAYTLPPLAPPSSGLGFGGSFDLGFPGSGLINTIFTVVFALVGISMLIQVRDKILIIQSNSSFSNSIGYDKLLNLGWLHDSSINEKCRLEYVSFSHELTKPRRKKPKIQLLNNLNVHVKPRMDLSKRLIKT